MLVEAKRRILELQNMQWVRKNAIGQVSPGLQSPCSAASLICHSSFICHSSNLSASLRLMTENMKRGVGSCCNKRRKPKPAVAKSEAVAAGSQRHVLVEPEKTTKITETAFEKLEQKSIEPDSSKLNRKTRHQEKRTEHLHLYLPDSHLTPSAASPDPQTIYGHACMARSEMLL